MSRIMLFIHPSSLLHKIVIGYTQAELSDLLIDDVYTAEDGLKQLKEKKYDIILSALEMDGLSGLELFRLKAGLSANQNTPFILMTSTDNASHLLKLRDAGLKHVLVSPFTGKQLARLVDDACDPREKRAHQRFSIPGTEALIRLENQVINASVVNICKTGMLCEISYQDTDISPFKPVRIDIVFPDGFGRARAENITAALLRVNVMTWSSQYSPDIIRAAFHFPEMPKSAANVLDMVLETAARELARDQLSLEGKI